MANGDQPVDNTSDFGVDNSSTNPHELVEFALDAASSVSGSSCLPDDPDFKVALEIISLPMSRADLVPVIVETLRMCRTRAREAALNEARAALDFLQSATR